ncbi:TetR/AcrR family transcriptional regulator [Bradyrhizobium sp. USDA 4502]
MISEPVQHRTARGAARLHALTDAAADMFLDQGYEAVSLDTLIAKVGGSRRNIYQHFGGKEGLFIEVVTQLCEEISQPLVRLKIDHKHARQALTDLGRQLLKLVLQPRTLALHRLMVAEGQRFPELAQSIWRAGPNNAVRILAGWIDRRQPAEFRHDISSEVLASQFVNMVVSEPQLRALVGLDPRPLRSGQIARMVDEAVEIFLAGALK